MKTTPHGCLILALILLGSCAKSEEQEAIASTLVTTVEALEEGDLSALWQVTAPEARAALLELHTRVHAGLETLDQVVDKMDLSAARKAIAGDFIGGISLDDPQRGPLLLEALLDPSTLQLGQAARDGLASAGAKVTGNRAEVRTTAEEVFRFEKTDEGWRSALVTDLLRRNPAFKQIESNLETVLEQAKTNRLAWIQSKDPSTPNGAFNLAREARDTGETATLFALTAPAFRQVFLETLTKSRDLQRRLRKGIRRPKRKAIYAAHGIGTFIKVESDQALFNAWLKEGSAALLPLPDDIPQKLEGDITTGHVTLVTAKGATVDMVRGPDDIWRLSGKTVALRKALLAPIDSQLKDVVKGTNG